MPNRQWGVEFSENPACKSLERERSRRFSKISDSRIAGSHSEDGGRVFFEPGKLGKAGGPGQETRAYLAGREPVMRMSTSLLALCCQSGLVATLATPIRARSRSIASRSLRMSPLLIARLTIARIASQIRA